MILARATPTIHKPLNERCAHLARIQYSNILKSDRANINEAVRQNDYGFASCTTELLSRDYCLNALKNTVESKEI